MKLRQILSTFLMGLGLCGLLLFWLGKSSTTATATAPLTATNATIRYVSPTGNCFGLSPCYASLQAAVDAATSGDVIKVAAGTYSDISVRPRNDITTTSVVTQVVYITKSVTIRGGYNADFSIWNPDIYSTTLDAHGQGRGIYIVGNINPTIEGLSITGGNAAGFGGYSYYGIYDVGGGVYIMTATATLKNNQIFSNTSPFSGGGVYLGKSAGTLKDNIISNNNVVTGGGGGGLFLFQGAPILDSNVVTANASENLGGGLYLFSTDATLRGNTIAQNIAKNNGGGVNVASCNPTFSGNVITGNFAKRGGGLDLWYSHSTLINNVIADNQATAIGSGLYIGGSKPRLLHNTIARNTGGDGSGIWVTDNGGTSYSTLTMTNTVLVSQTVGITVDAGSAATLQGVLWFGNGTNYGGAGSVIITNATPGDPAFAPDGYHLTSASAAIDKGVVADVTTDIDNQPRFGVPDLGADEYLVSFETVYLPLVIRN